MSDRDEPPPIELRTAAFRRLCDAEQFLNRLETAAVAEVAVEIADESEFVVRWRT